MGTVIKINPDVEIMPVEDYEPPEIKIAIVDERHKFCPHERIKLFQHHRYVICSDCGATIEPFEHLLHIGKKENGTLSQLTFLRYQVKQAEQDLANLKKEMSKLTAQKRKLA